MTPDTHKCMFYTGRQDENSLYLNNLNTALLAVPSPSASLAVQSVFSLRPSSVVTLALSWTLLIASPNSFLGGSLVG